MSKHKTFTLTKTKTSLTTALLVIIAIGAVASVAGAFATALWPTVTTTQKECLYKGTLIFANAPFPNFYTKDNPVLLDFVVNTSLLVAPPVGEAMAELNFTTESSYNIEGARVELYKDQLLLSTAVVERAVGSLPTEEKFLGKGKFTFNNGFFDDGYRERRPGEPYRENKHSLSVKGYLPANIPTIGQPLSDYQTVIFTLNGYKEQTLSCPIYKAQGLPVSNSISIMPAR
ncbi:MAG: hypothetical protein V1684_01560 [bacterium]